MSDGPALLASVLAAPADDAPRLVYADWLDENGQPERAELIRVQCRMDELLRTNGPAEEHAALWPRVAELLTPQRFWAWFDIPGWPGSPQADVMSGGDVVIGYGQRDRAFWQLGIRRGFWTIASLPAADWIQHGDALSWSPEQTVPCPNTRCVQVMYGPQRRRVFTAAEEWEDCDHCKGTGRVPRPCPPTAHPVTEVRLTTMPLGSEWDGMLDVSTRADAGDYKFVHPRWRGVTFTAPSPFVTLAPREPR